MKNAFFNTLFLLVITSFSVFSQSVNVTIIYNGAQSQGCCNVCGSDYTCFNNTGGCGTTAACGSRNFNDPVPPGNVVTGVLVTYYAAGCHASSVASQINGVALSATPTNSQCACGSCTAYTSGTASFPCPGGLPSYNYGGSNSFTCCPNGAFCPQRVVITLTYTAKSVAPTSATASPNPSCGGPITLTKVGGSLGAGASWKWYSGSCGGTPEGTGASITVTPTSTITYYVRAEGGGCGNTACASVTVTFNTLSVAPTSATASPSTTCGGPTTLTVAGGSLGTGATWDWFSGSCGGTAEGTGASVTVTPTATTTYFVRAGGGCGNTACASVIVTVNPTPFAVASPMTPTICSGDSTHITISSFTPGTTFAWTVVQNGVTGASAGSGSSITQVLTALSVQGNAIYSIIPTANGCAGPAVYDTVKVNPRPIAIATPPSQTICSGIVMSVILSSLTPGTTFSWTVVQSGVTGGNSGNGTTISDSLQATGSALGTAIYKITPTANGCTGTPIFDTVTVNPNPGSTAIATPSAPNICSGATTSIALTSSTSGTIFSWTVTQVNVSGASAGTGSNIAQTLTSATHGVATYAVTAVANGCTSNQLTVIVNVYPVPTVTAVPITQTFCSGDTTSITMTSIVPGTIFSWTVSPSGVNGATFGSDSSHIHQILTNPGTSPGTVIYTITPSAHGCSGTPVTVTVTVNPSDNPSFVYTSATYCQSGVNPTPTITGLPGGVFTSVPAGLIINPATGTINLATSALGLYTLCYATNGLCPGSSCISMTIDNSTPFATFTYPASPYCINGTDPYPLFGSGASAGTFTSSPAGLVFVHVNTGQIDLSASQPGTYTVTNTIPPSGTCGLAIGTATVVITTADDASFTYPSATYCQSGTNPTPTITGLPGGTFSATPSGLQINPTTGTINLAGSAWGPYTLSYTTFGVCPNTSSITMTIDSMTPSATFTYAGSPFCQYGNNPVPIFASGASAGMFTATPAGLVFVHVNTGQINLPLSAPGTYTVTNTIPASGICLAVTATTTVVINPAPVATATPGGNLFVCSGATYPVAIVLSSSMPGTTYSWTATDAGVTGAVAGNGSAINQTLTFIGPTVGTAVYTITPNANGCIGLPTTVNITIHKLPAADTTAVVIAPANCGTATGSVTGIVNTSGLAPIVYQWHDSNGSPVGTNSITLNNVGPGTYFLTITDANNCPITTGPYVVSATPAVVAAFTPNPLTGETPLTVTFTNNSVNAATYQWTFGTGDVSTATSPAYVYHPLGNFKVCLVAISATNCTDTLCDSIHVFINSVFIVPNIFTPNGDNINDVFMVKAAGLKTMDAEIYNRWGEKEYEWHTTSGGWDGHTASGVLAPSATYFYIIKAKGIDGKEYFEKGSFSLVTDK